MERKIAFMQPQFILVGLRQLAQTNDNWYALLGEPDASGIRLFLFCDQEGSDDEGSGPLSPAMPG